MSLSTSVRFEVLKRDRYTCSYCGKHPPDVLLEVDHITPVAAGGTDEMHNLTTACWDCNRGKGARLLEEGTAPAINRAAVAEMAERVEQAKAYMDLLGTMESILDDQVHRFTRAWAQAYRATTEEEGDGVFYRLIPGAWPEDQSVRNFIRKLGLASVLDAVAIASARITWPGPESVRYFYGVCHTSIREHREPSSPQREPQSDSYGDYLHGLEHGRETERERIGAILLNYQEHGFAYLADAVAALWPTDG